MATVPGIPGDAPSVRETAIAAPKATPAAFGAIQGRQLQDVGAATRNVGAAASNIVLKMQERANIEAVTSAESVLIQSETDFHTSVRERRGVNAEGVQKDAIDFWDEANKVGRDTLSNNAQKTAYDRLYNRRRQASMSFVAQHRVTESGNALSASTKADVAAAQQNGVANPGARVENAAVIKDSYTVYGQHFGLPTAATKLNIQAATSKMHEEAIDNLIDQHPGAATAYYEEIKKEDKGRKVENREISPDRTDEIEKKLRDGNLRRRSQVKADAIVTEFPGDERAQMAAAKKITNAEERDAVTTRLRATQADDKRLSAEEQNENFQAAQRVAFSDDFARRSYNDLPSRFTSNISGDQEGRLRSYFAARDKAVADGGAKIIDYPMLDEAQSGIEKGDITDERQLDFYQYFMPKPEFAALRKKLATAQTISPTIVKAEFENRIGKSRAKWIDDTGIQEQWSMFQKQVNDKIGAGEARPQDISQIADDFFVEMYKPNSGFFFDDKLIGGEVTAQGVEGEFVRETPTETRAFVSESIKLLSDQGVGVQTGEVAVDEFYTRWHVPSVRYLQRQEMQVTPSNVAAIMLLMKNKRAISPEFITNIAGQMTNGN